jgi:hypothetical protein
MGSQTRRGLLKFLASTPALFVVGAKPLFATSQNAATNPAKLPAVQVLRFLNTAQHWHKNIMQSYALSTELAASPAVRELGESDEAEGRGMGASYIKLLNFSSKEILPGWLWDLRVSQDRSGYVLTVQSATDPATAFSTTNEGLIFEGKPIANIGSEIPLDAKPLPATNLSGVNALSRRLASMTLLMFDCRWYQCSQCTDYPCCTDCTCQCGSIGIAGVKCWNCGCDSCRWCCDIY